jgi:hypothetical protein
MIKDFVGGDMGCAPLVISDKSLHLFPQTRELFPAHPDRSRPSCRPRPAICSKPNRLMSTLECARLQTFPAAFKWGKALKKWGHTNVRDMVGEAVPPLFTKKHGKILASLLSGRVSVRALSVENIRVRAARKKLGLLPTKNAKAKAMA